MPTGMYKRKLNKTTEQFIKEAKLIHGDKYDYSLVEYNGCKTNVNIKCKICGNIFAQLPSNHLHKTNPTGCPYCSDRKKLTNEEFIRRANLIHANKYSYDLSNYKNNKSYIMIKCEEHGWFKQQAHKHLCGNGCKECGFKNLGEEFAQKYFSDKGIKFEKWKSFEDLRDIKPLSYDFFLPEKNILIEIQGEGHFSENFMGKNNKEKFEKQKRHDLLKRNYALKNGFIFEEIIYLNSNRKKLKENLDKLIEKYYN